MIKKDDKMSKLGNNKRLFTLFIALTCVFLTLVACVCGCKKRENSSDDSMESVESVESDNGSGKEISLTLDKNHISIMPGEETLIKATYSGAGNEILIWSSSNDEIASVANGKVSANSIGEATISASYAGRKAECSVVVAANDMLPSMRFEGFPDQDSVTVTMSDKLNFNPVIKFNGKEYFDGQFSVTVVDESIGSVENGIFSPLKTGETVVTVEGSWRGLTGACLKKSFNVKVINSLSVAINGGLTSSLELYTVESHEGKAYDVSSPFVVSATENGNAIEYGVTVSEGNDVISYNAETQTVSALTYGKAVITIDFIDGEGVRGTLEVPVTVLRPVAVYDQVIPYFSAQDGDMPTNEIFGKDTQITDAYCKNEALTVNNGKVLGVETDRNGMSEQTVTVYDEKVGYTVKIQAYTKVLKEESDLSVFNENNDGYFVMKNDIVCSGATTVSNKGVFKGVFDGNGHIISGVKVSATPGSGQGGIFGTIGNSAVIRNLGLTDVDMSPYNSAILADKSVTPYNAGAVIENIYISVKKVGSRPGVIMWSRCPWDVIRNVVIDASCFGTSGLGTAYGTMFASDNYAVADNGSNWKKNVSNINSVYVIAKEGVPLSNNVAYSRNFPAIIYASNDGKTDNPSVNEYVYTGVKRFNDLFSLANSVNKVGDDENYWTITETTVEWKGKLPEFETVDYGKTVEFSAADGDLPIEDIFGKKDVVITEAYQGGAALSVVDNKVLGVATKRDGVTETSIIIVSAAGKYKVKLNAYTKIIDEESDFAVFDVTNGIVDGYYILGGDVTCKGEIEWKNVSADKETKCFNGVFDGRGYKIVGIRVGERGLFGALGNEAVIKNVAFTESVLSDIEEWKYTPFLAYDSAAGNNSGSKIENVYIQFANFREAKGGNRGAGLLFNYNSNITIKDVIIEIKTTNFNKAPQFGYGALFAQDKIHGEAKNLINVKVVSALMPMAMITDVDLNTGVAKNNWATYAGNDKDSADKLVKDSYYYYDTVTRYDSLSEMATTTTKVGNWKITAESVVWEENA